MRKGAGQLHLFHRVATAGAPTPAVQTSIFDADPSFAPPSFRPRSWWKEARNTMRDIRTGLQAAPDGIGARWAAALDRLYPGQHKAKRIAQDFAVDPRTAQTWLAGQEPHVKHLCRAGLRHGPAVVLEVLVPGTDAAAGARIDAQLATLETRFAALHREISELRGGSAGG